MKDNLCELIVIADKSGSMSSIVSDAIGGFNTLLKEQKKSPFDIRMTTVLFDTDYTLKDNATPIKEVKEFDNKSYYPSGATALYDAIGKTIDEVGKRLSNINEDERPSKVLVAIFTDGEENSSKEYPHQKILDMIIHQREKYNWEFIYLAANQDAFAVGSSMGIMNNISYCSTGRGITNAHIGISTLTSAYYSGGSVALSKTVDSVQKSINAGELNEN